MSKKKKLSVPGQAQKVNGRWPAAVKAQCLQLAEQRSINDAAHITGVPVATIRTWMARTAKARGRGVQEDDAKRHSDGRWKKGESGNPDGCSSAAIRVKAKAARLAEALLDQMSTGASQALIAKDPDMVAQGLAIAREMLDRGVGRVPSPDGVAQADGRPGAPSADDMDLSVLDDNELSALEGIIRKLSGARVAQHATPGQGSTG